MSDVNPDTHFRGTCKPVKYPCVEGVYFVDPCDCHNYYRCAQLTIGENRCPEQTAWDYINNGCRIDNDIFLNGICDFESPWLRCNQTDGVTDPAELEKIKVNVCNITGSSVFTTTTPLPPQQDGGGSDAGTIAAGIVGGILAILVILIIVFVVMRKKKGKPLPDAGSIKQYMSRKRKGKLTNTSSIDNPSYHHEEVYTEIDDMGDPTYQAEPNSSTTRNHLSVSVDSSHRASPVLPARALTDTTKEAMTIQQKEDDTVYDNRTDALRSYVEVVSDSPEDTQDNDNEQRQRIDSQGYLEASNMEDKRAFVQEEKDKPGYYVLEKDGDKSTDVSNSN